MKVTYQNRYGDDIVFEKEANTVKMTGYSPYLRFGYPNVYDNAYDAYCKDTEDPMDLDLFKDKIHEWNGEKPHPLKIYQSLIYSDTSTYDMVDPSGGPYLAVGTNLKYYFGVKQDIIIESIHPEKDHILFKIK